MSFYSTQRIELKCRTPRQSTGPLVEDAALSIDFGPAELQSVTSSTDFVTATIQVAFEVDPEFGIESSCFHGFTDLYGYTISRFANEIEQLRERMIGTAQLLDREGNVVLTLSISDRRFGEVALEGVLAPLKLWSREGPAGGVRGTFRGLTTEQTFLTPLIVGLRRFLEDSQIQVTETWPW